MDSYDAIILGAGPSGLTAAYCLAKHRARIALVERSPHLGGLMRGVQRGEFSLDLGRKELYSRFPEVHSLWSELLGKDYRPYPHRVGVLAGGRILERDVKYKGRFRGMSPFQAGRTLAGALWSQVKPGRRQPRSQEEYMVLRYGRPFYEYLHYGYLKKFEGYDPRDLPPPQGVGAIPRFAAFRRRPQAESAAARSGRQQDWYHPARGTQQIADGMCRGAQTGGAEILVNAEVLGLETAGAKLQSVIVRRDGQEHRLETRCAVVSLPAPVILKLLRPAPPEELLNPPKEEIAFRKSTALVYLLAHGEPRFPHNWLEVTDPRFRMGRVVNYATWGGEMVPTGKTALCVEYFAVEGDGLMDLSPPDLLKLAVSEAEQNRLLDASQIFDHLVIRLPTVNAATVFTDWRVAWMKKAMAYLHGIEGLLETNRPGMDRAALAGIDAATACIAGKPMSGRSLEETPGWE